MAKARWGQERPEEPEEAWRCQREGRKVYERPREAQRNHEKPRKAKRDQERPGFGNPRICKDMCSK